MNLSKFIKALSLFVFLIGSVQVMAQSYLPSNEAMTNIATKVNEIGENPNSSEMDIETAIFSKDLYKKLEEGMSVSEAATQTISDVEAKYADDSSMMNGIKNEIMSLITDDN